MDLLEPGRELAGERAEQLELSMNDFVVGDRVEPWVQRFIGADAETLIARDSLTMLRGTFAPVIPLLDGR